MGLARCNPLPGTCGHCVSPGLSCHLPVLTWLHGESTWLKLKWEEQRGSCSSTRLELLLPFVLSTALDVMVRLALLACVGTSADSVPASQTRPHLLPPQIRPQQVLQSRRPPAPADPSSTGTVLLPVTSSTTLNILRTTLLEALTLSRPEADSPLDPEPVTLPKAASEIALWKKDEENEEEEVKWILLADEKSGADKWGL